MDKEIRKSLGLMIIVGIHVAAFIVGYCLIEYTNLASFIIVVLLVAFGDIVKLGLRIVKYIFKIEMIDLDMIQSDDIQPLETQ